MSESVMLFFSLRVFIVSGLTFRSLIHFEFTFVCDVSECSKFILLHVAVLFSQHSLLKRLSCLHLYSCLLCQRLGDHRCMGFSLFFLPCYIDLVLFFAPVPYCFDSFVVYSEGSEPDPFSSAFLSQDSFDYAVVF